VRLRTALQVIRYREPGRAGPSTKASKHMRGYAGYQRVGTCSVDVSTMERGSTTRIERRGRVSDR
jgi:hypothetical protein